MFPLVALLLCQAPVAIVFDVSAPDAVYEDVSRGVADSVVSALGKAGFEAVRVDENELPRDGCRAGPCLGKVSKAHGAALVVTVDVEEDGKTKLKVGLAAMRGTDGMPLGAQRFGQPVEPKKPPKPLTKFCTGLPRALEKANEPPKKR
jgi:hypothetical protein